MGSLDSGGEATGLLTPGSPAADEGDGSGISDKLAGVDLPGDMSSDGALLRGGRTIPSSISASAVSSAAISWRMLLSKVRDLVGFFFINRAVAGLGSHKNRTDPS